MKNKTPPVIVRVHRPDITPEERVKRMGQISQSAAALIMAVKK